MKKFAKIVGCVRRRQGIRSNIRVGTTDESKHKKKPQSGVFKKMKTANSHYPERTTGAKHARDLRDRTNHLSEKQQAELIAEAMKQFDIPYAIGAKATAGAGH